MQEWKSERANERAREREKDVFIIYNRNLPFSITICVWSYNYFIFKKLLNLVLIWKIKLHFCFNEHILHKLIQLFLLFSNFICSEAIKMVYNSKLRKDCYKKCIAIYSFS